MIELSLWPKFVMIGLFLSMCRLLSHDFAVFRVNKASWRLKMAAESSQIHRVHVPDI